MAEPKSAGLWANSISRGAGHYKSVQSHMGSEKLIPNPPHVEDILDWEWVNTKFKSDIAPQSQKMILSDAPLMSLVLYYCDVVEHLMKEAPCCYHLTKHLSM